MATAVRRVICPTCGYANDAGERCRVCKQDIVLAKNDLQSVEFLGMDDGYHSWHSQPTSVHERYRCKHYGSACNTCVHASPSDVFCFRGRIDVRRMRKQRLDGTVYYEYEGWTEMAH